MSELVPGVALRSLCADCSIAQSSLLVFFFGGGVRGSSRFEGDTKIKLGQRVP